jgi:hypothetical protein
MLSGCKGKDRLYGVPSGAPEVGTNKVLSVHFIGNGSGYVRPNGTDTASSDHNYEFSPGQSVLFEAIPFGSFTFTGWGGGTCSGTSPCNLIMNSDVYVTVSFN